MNKRLRSEVQGAQRYLLDGPSSIHQSTPPSLVSKFVTCRFKIEDDRDLRSMCAAMKIFDRVYNRCRIVVNHLQQCRKTSLLRTSASAGT